MRLPLLILGIFSFIFGPPSAPENAAAAAAEGNHRKAVEWYRQGLEAYATQAELLLYNMGQEWMALDSVDSATIYYQKVEGKAFPLVASDALNNTAVLNVKHAGQQPPTQPAPQPGAASGAEAPSQDPQMQAIDQALVLLREAMRKNHKNETARYNYELLMKRKQQQQNQNQNQPPPPQEEEKEEEKEKQEQNSQSQPQQRPKENQSAPSDPVDDKQADQLMEALKENEKRFIQQIKKKPHRQVQDNTRPSW